MGWIRHGNHPLGASALLGGPFGAGVLPAILVFVMVGCGGGVVVHPPVLQPITIVASGAPRDWLRGNETGVMHYTLLWMR